MTAHIKSLPLAKDLVTLKLEKRLRKIIAERIEREGVFRIARSVGLVEAIAT